MLFKTETCLKFQRKVGLVMIPAKFLALTSQLHIAKSLKKELQSRAISNLKTSSYRKIDFQGYFRLTECNVYLFFFLQSSNKCYFGDEN